MNSMIFAGFANSFGSVCSAPRTIFLCKREFRMHRIQAGLLGRNNDRKMLCLLLFQIYKVIRLYQAVIKINTMKKKYTWLAFKCQLWLIIIFPCFYCISNELPFSRNEYLLPHGTRKNNLQILTLLP
jgi:hypothetical protein